MRTSLLTVTALFGAMAAPLLAEEARPSRHVYRGNDSGTAERLAQPRVASEPVRVVKTQPLGQRGTSTGTVAASNLSSQSQVIASGSTYGVDVRQPTPGVQYVTAPPPANQDRTRVDNNARILAASASPDYRLAVDRNARVVRNYAIYQEQQQGQPLPQPQSDAQPLQEQQQPDAQPQAGFVSVPPPQPNQQIVYGNTYGTYSPQRYESNLKYTQPVTYTVERNYYYPVSYAPTYCPPSYTYVSYYRPSYSYCAPAYYAPRYYSSGYCGPRYYGGGYGGYVGYRSGGYYGSSYGGYVGYSSGGRCGGGNSWAFGFRF